MEHLSAAAPWTTHIVQSPLLLAFMVTTFVASGMVKGTLGVGLPLLAVPMLSLVVPPPIAISLLAVPVLASNLWQAVDSYTPGTDLKRFVPLVAALLLSTLITVRLALALPTEVLSILVAAAVLVAVALMSFKPRRVVPPAHEKGVGAVVGALAGAMGGVSSMTGPFIITYLMALRLSREQFIGSVSVIYLFGVIPLYASMAAYGRLGLGEVAVSLAALLPMAAGMAIGKRLRHRLSEAAFRRVLLAFLVVIAVLLIVK